MHRGDGLAVLELEPDSAPGAREEDALAAVSRVLSPLSRVRGTQGLLRAVADAVRALIGFDRVMVYRFDADWHGEVVAESLAEGVDVLSLQLGAEERGTEAEELVRRDSLRSRLMERLSQGVHALPATLARERELLLALTGAGGAALLLGESPILVGATPPMSEVVELAFWLAERSFGSAFYTERLAELYPPAAAYTDVASGLLAVRLDSNPTLPRYALWLRPEVTRAITSRSPCAASSGTWATSWRTMARPWTRRGASSSRTCGGWRSVPRGCWMASSSTAGWVTSSGPGVRIRQVLANLLVNAAKYHQEGGSRWVEVGFHGPGEPFAHPKRRRPEDYVCYVRDNGIGIPEQFHEAIFEMFRRLHPARAYGGGSGAGLAIARRLARLHGGELWVESAPGQGSTFFFTLGERARG